MISKRIEDMWQDPTFGYQKEWDKNVRQPIDVENDGIGLVFGSLLYIALAFLFGWLISHNADYGFWKSFFFGGVPIALVLLLAFRYLTAASAGGLLFSPCVIMLLYQYLYQQPGWITSEPWAIIIAIAVGLTIALSLKMYAGVALPWMLIKYGLINDPNAGVGVFVSNGLIGVVIVCVIIYLLRRLFYKPTVK